MDDSGTTRSPLCTSFTEADVTVQVEIYQLYGSVGWILELVHTDGGCTIWLSEFETDRAAMAEFMTQVARIGLATLTAETHFHFPTLH